MDFRQALTDLATLHHAYAIEGAYDAHDTLLAHLSAIGFEAKGHPDAFVRTYEHLGIDESRELTIRASRKPLAASRSIAVVMTPVITIEAQQALLKTFEEPSASISFFLIVPSVEMLLPTLRSRMQLLRVQAGEDAAATSAAAAFLAASASGRMKQIEPIVKERRMGEVLALLAGLERLLAANIQDEGARSGLRAVYRARAYCADKGALLKPLLEQVALLVPVR